MVCIVSLMTATRLIVQFDDGVAEDHGASREDNINKRQ